MTNPAPHPIGDAGIDLDRLTTDVATALDTDQDADTPAQLELLEALHQRLAAALTTIDHA